MADCPKCCTLAGERGVGGENLLFEVINVIGLFQVLCTLHCFDKFAVQVHGGLNDFVLLGEDLDFEDNAV